MNAKQKTEALKRVTKLCQNHVKFAQDKVAVATWTHAMVVSAHFWILRTL